jgi:ABC-type bacteriocin/lantibiotic exporter with double-glycine peptidase domain
MKFGIDIKPLTMPRAISLQLYQYLQLLEIPVSFEYLSRKIQSHPDYPSLLSITDTLDELGIDSATVHIGKGQLHEAPVPFMAHLNGNGGEFVIIKNLSNPDK